MSEYGRAVAERSEVRTAYETELTEAQRRLRAIRISQRARLNCGGLVSKVSTVLTIPDFVVVYQRALDSGRSFFEELDVQAANEREDSGLMVGFAGPIPYVFQEIY